MRDETLMVVYMDDRAGEPLPEGLEELLRDLAKQAVRYAARDAQNAIIGGGNSAGGGNEDAALTEHVKPAGSAGYEVSLSLVTPAEICQLNRDYRGVDLPTDVLSFPFLEDAPAPSGQSAALPLALGDIVICPTVARAQAAEYGHSYRRELAFLFTHGGLHLLGYDHEDEPGESRMKAAQETILNEAGVPRAE